MFLEDPNIITQLVEAYGPTGVAFGILLTILLRKDKASDKRIRDLEEHQEELHKTNIEIHKGMIDDYVDLVRSKTQVLADLTGCLRAIKDTLERIERKD